MILAYIDESGNSGYGKKTSHTYTLACVLLTADRWPEVFDQMIAFRRFLRDRFKIRVRDEIKANYLLRKEGPFENLKVGDDARRKIYRAFMRLAPKLKLKVFAVVIQKRKILQQNRDPRDIAWEYMLQRLERYSTKNQMPILVVHDEGENNLVAKLARKARRAGTAGSAFGTGTLKVPLKLLVDDPVPRNSRQSYFIQLADLAAYAAFRRCVPPSPKSKSVCPETTWDELGDGRLLEAAELAGGHAAIVEWPK